MADTVVETSTVLGAYRLEDQIGFYLRRAGQRHAAIFASHLRELTPTQWAALVKLAEYESVSQNLLGRETAMDAATIKGVVDRLVKRGLAATASDPADGRRMRVSITREGLAAVTEGVAPAHAITKETIAPLNAAEQRLLLDLLQRIA